jgi:hypothetical protein
MNKNFASAVSALVVRAADGSVDTNATVAAVQAATLKFLASGADSTAEIRSAVDAAIVKFSGGKDVYVNSGLVTTTAAMTIAGADSSSIAALQKEVGEWLTANTTEVKKDSATPTTLYVSRRGQNGGLKRNG